ncbi:caspase, EACC1-associated type [Streptomyces sp. ME19-01-6]|uniref:caspase, EACC1-associated type n=1 Tax=Streptomyces sp. ME19-01-6 TaxID=3028686 RepID=UPI0029B2A77E|nr:ABC transporter substrate-binding protein [Streptomyces sp. ME19-01-6]MDX3226098.1 ABC transporter substrate-binding protein [Streptomyces sp. ME19-01-6]
MTVLPAAAASRAVLIGTSRYDHLEQLPQVQRNLRALAAALCAPHSWGLAPEHCTVIEDPEAAVEVLDAVRAAAEEATDTLLVYFAGHGLVEPRRGELVLSLAGSLRQRSYTGLPYGTLRDVMSDGRANRRVVLLDCCLSGETPGFVDGIEAVVDRAAVDDACLLAAVPDSSFALAPPGGPHTAFTGELLRLLNEGVPGGPRLLDLDTVYGQVYAAMGAQGRPLPHKRDRGGIAGGIALGRNTAPVMPVFGPTPPAYAPPGATAPLPHPPYAPGQAPPPPPAPPAWPPAFAPAQAPGSGSPGNRRLLIRSAIAAAVVAGLLAAGIPLVNNWMDDDSSQKPAAKPSPTSTPTKKASAPAYNDATKGVVNPSKARGGTLKFVGRSDADSWDPQRSYYGFAWNFSRYFTRTLVTYAPKPDKGGSELVPDLATSKGKVSEDGTTYTYTLREGLTWEDGSSITSQDVKYGIERAWATDVLPGGPTYLKQVLDPDGKYKGPYKDDKLGLTSIDTPTSKTIVFHLAEPNSDFEQMLAMPAGSPVPSAKDTKAKYQQRPFSSGPYKFSSYAPGKSLELIRNAEWNQSSDPVRAALPDRITVDFVQDDNARSQRLFAGSYDMDLQPTLSKAAIARAVHDTASKARLDDPYTMGIRYLGLPRTVKPLNNIHCRKAIIYGTDRRSVQTALGGPGAGEIATNMLPPGIEGANPTDDPYDVLENGGKANGSEAKKELAACGKPNGFQTNVAVRAGNPDDLSAAEALKSSLSSVGISITIEQIELSNYYTAVGSPSTVKKKGYGIILGRWLPDFPTAQGFLQPLVDGRFILPAGNVNFAQLDDKSINGLFDKALAGQDRRKIREMYRQINRKVSDSAGYVPLIFQKNYTWRSPRLTNVYTSHIYGGSYDFASLGVSP